MLIVVYLLGFRYISFDVTGTVHVYYIPNDHRLFISLLHKDFLLIQVICNLSILCTT